MKKKFQIVLLMLILLFATSANAAPMAYSVNSDSGNLATEDSLFLIDLATGNNLIRGELISGIESRLDTEGLAFAPGGTLWGIDDDSRTLFPVNANSGAIKFQDEIPLAGFKSGGGNDFGMTFSCDNSLYITSVRTQTLYQLNLDGSSEVVGALGVNISAIAAIGTPTRLYGLGNGQFQDGSTDAPELYSIDATTGVASLIGPLGAQAGEYNQAGLAFDADGNLWAITDRRIINDSIANLPSQILKIDVDTGSATMISETSEVGFESLAIAPPAACNIAQSPGYGYQGPGDQAIPTLSSAGRLLAVFIMLLAGMAVLRRRFS
jgi:hypothetical protein